MREPVRVDDKRVLMPMTWGESIRALFKHFWWVRYKLVEMPLDDRSETR